MQQTSEKTELLFPALFKARVGFVKVLKDKVNGHTKASYATLDSVLDTIEPPLTANELWIEQSMTEDSTIDMLKVITTVRHSSGQWISYFTVMPVSKKDAQGTGSAFTYARRYALAACFGLSQADDDAERSIKKASDWKKSLDKCETLEDLQEEFKKAWAGSDAASRPVVQSHYEQRKASMSVPQAKGGFQPAKKGDKQNVSAQVASPTAEPVQSNPQSIESFE
jgi:hypothetical protein